MGMVLAVVAAVEAEPEFVVLELLSVDLPEWSVGATVGTAPAVGVDIVVAAIVAVFAVGVLVAG